MVWVHGTYPIEREDYNIELVLFMPVNLNDGDSETQSIFEKDNFFSVGAKLYREIIYCMFNNIYL